MEPATGMSAITAAITSIVTAAMGWAGSAVTFITDSGHELVLFSALVGFLGVGIGLLKRFFKLHA